MVCLDATVLLFAIDSECSTGSIFQENGESFFATKQAFKSINKENERLTEKQQ